MGFRDLFRRGDAPARRTRATAPAAPVMETLEGRLMLNAAPSVEIGLVAALNVQENSSARVAPTAVVQDADGSTLQKAYVRLSQNHQPRQDRLTINAHPVIKTHYNHRTGMLLLRGKAPLGAYRKALRTLRYRNISENPTRAQREVTVRVHDGTTWSAPDRRGIFVTPVEDGAVLTCSAGAMRYAGGKGARPVDWRIKVRDKDSRFIDSAVVKIMGRQEGDALSMATRAGHDGAVLRGIYDAASGILTITGKGTVGQYQRALRSVKFSNPNARTSRLRRRVAFRTAYEGVRSARWAYKQVRFRTAGVLRTAEYVAPSPGTLLRYDATEHVSGRSATVTEWFPAGTVQVNGHTCRVRRSRIDDGIPKRYFYRVDGDGIALVRTLHWETDGYTAWKRYDYRPPLAELPAHLRVGMVYSVNGDLPTARRRKSPSPASARTPADPRPA